MPSLSKHRMPYPFSGQFIAESGSLYTGLSVHIIGELICGAILLLITSKQASEPDKNLENKISELEVQVWKNLRLLI